MSLSLISQNRYTKSSDEHYLTGAICLGIVLTLRLLSSRSPILQDDIYKLIKDYQKIKAEE